MKMDGRKRERMKERKRREREEEEEEEQEEGKTERRRGAGGEFGDTVLPRGVMLYSTTDSAFITN